MEQNFDIKEERGLIYFKCDSYERTLQIIKETLKLTRYHPFNKIPDGYIEKPGEFQKGYLLKEEKNGWFLLVWDEYEFLYRWVLKLSKIFLNTPVLGYLDSSKEGHSIKLYLNGNLILKIGKDSDEELFYYAPRPTEESVGKFLDILLIQERKQREGIREIINKIDEGKIKFSISLFETFLKLPNADISLKSLKKGSFKDIFSYLLFVRDDSPLFI